MAHAMVHVWILADANGDTATGSTAEEAREHYEENIGPLCDCEGFRMVRVKVVVPLPEAAMIELEAEAPALEPPSVEDMRNAL